MDYGRRKHELVIIFAMVQPIVSELYHPQKCGGLKLKRRRFTTVAVPPIPQFTGPSGSQ